MATHKNFSDEDILKKLGLDSANDATSNQQIVESIREAAELRYGTELADRLTDEQFAELEKRVDTDEPEAIEAWLGTIFPDKDQLRDEILTETVNTIKSQLDSILNH